MTRAQSAAMAAALAGGLLGALLLLGTQRDPCGALLRRYAIAYEALKRCGSDAECVVDAPPPRGPAVCDRARAASSSRGELERVERAWAEACPAPGADACPAIEGARCLSGRCVTALRREAPRAPAGGRAQAGEAALQR